MKGSIVAAFVAIAITACGRTELATQPPTPTLAAQGMPVRTSISRTQTFNLESPCTGEMMTGTVNVTGWRQMVTDANGGVHIHIQAFFTGAYVGETGTTFTDRLRSRLVINRTSSGTLIVTDLGTGLITGSDGTKILDRGRFALVVNANGEVRVDRGSGGAICLRG